MAKITHYDLRGVSFDQFVAFLFRSGIAGTHEKFWYWEAEVIYEPSEIASHYIKLCTEPRFLLEQFPTLVLEEAFWAIQVQNLDCSAYNVIWETEVPFGLREGCVRSMFHLFERLFAIAPLNSAPFMWWDSFCYDWFIGHRSRDSGGEEEVMQDVMFETICRILALESLSCQKAALHGLGHLRHPDTDKVIGQFLEEHPSIPHELRAYAFDASKFEVQ